MLERIKKLFRNPWRFKNMYRAYRIEKEHEAGADIQIIWVTKYVHVETGEKKYKADNYGVGRFMYWNDKLRKRHPIRAQGQWIPHVSQYIEE